MRYAALAFVTAIAVLASSPIRAAPDSHLGVKPEDIVTLQWRCNVGTPTRILSNGERLEDFEVPSKRRLVITDFEWRVAVTGANEGESYIVEVQLSDSTGLQTPVYLAIVPTGWVRGSLSDHLTSALVLDSTVALDNDAGTPHPRLQIFGVAEFGPAANCDAILRGYLINQ